MILSRLIKEFLKRTRWRTAPFIKKYTPYFFSALLQKWTRGFPKYPLLRMILTDLNNLPSVCLPRGYQIKTLENADKREYLHVMNHSLEKSADEEWFHKNFFNKPDYNPKNLFIIFNEKREPVAAAAASCACWKSRRIGFIEKIGVVHKFQGKGIGRAVCLLALKRIKEQGLAHAILETEDSRIPAICLFLSLGFRPLCRERFDEFRWKKVLWKIQQFKSQPLKIDIQSLV